MSFLHPPLFPILSLSLSLSLGLPRFIQQIYLLPHWEQLDSNFLSFEVWRSLLLHLLLHYPQHLKQRVDTLLLFTPFLPLPHWRL